MRGAWILAIAACNESGSRDDGGAPVDSADPTLPVSATLMLDDRSNFAYSATCALPEIALATGVDFTLDWSTLTRDLLGRPFDPADVRDAILSARTDTAAEIRAGIAEESLDEGAVVEGWHFEPDGRRSVQASEMLYNSHPFVPEDDLVEGQTYLAALVDAELQILSAATATAGGSATTLAIDDSARLDWTGTLSPVALATTPELGPWTLDWSGLTRDSVGRPLDPLAMDQLFLARLDVEDDAQVAAALLDLEAAAVEWYVKYVAGVTSIDAALLSTVDGEDEFEGFTATGTWVVGMRCGSCGTRVPQFAAVVRVR